VRERARSPAAAADDQPRRRTETAPFVAAFRETLRRRPTTAGQSKVWRKSRKRGDDGPRQNEEEARLARAWIGDRTLLDLKRL
jgi:hypothetical protein